jgi:hypothetical protein
MKMSTNISGRLQIREELLLHAHVPTMPSKIPTVAPMVTSGAAPGHAAAKGVVQKVC